MGIFDALTGDPAKQASQQNKDLLWQNLGFGLGELGNGAAQGRQDTMQGIAAFDPLSALGQKYGAATSLYQDSLGVNGAAGNQRAQGAFQTGPGYQFALDQSMQAANRGAAGSGMLNSGNTLQALQDRGMGMANQEYGNWQNRLSGFMPGELSAVGGAAQGRAAGYGNMAGISERLGVNKTNLATTMAGGISNANNQSAQAQMQGNQNMWGMGMNLAKLGMGFM